MCMYILKMYDYFKQPTGIYTSHQLAVGLDTNPTYMQYLALVYSNRAH